MNFVPWINKDYLSIYLEVGLVENLVNVIGDLVTESPVESAGLAQVGNQVGDVLEVEETVVRSDVSELLDQVNV